MFTPTKFLRREKGFTLVELLVVIAIIGVLATLVLLQLGTARARARDTKRITDVNQIRTAVEQYFEDNGGVYPTAITAAEIGRYLTRVPVDPLTSQPYGYAYNPAAAPSQFQIWATLEQTAAALTSDADIDSSGWSGDTNSVGAGDSDCAKTKTSCVYDQGIQ
ncbi:MAG: type II secretion system protein [Candidatus Yanofskybacteria bacterium]|nr:type II secretion system protein [Candidatus Yanofskybacteria bacterium]